MSFLKNIFSLSATKFKITKNIYWAVIGKIINMAGALLVGVLVARYLGPDEYGLMNYIISYVALFMVIANFGLENIEIRELSKNKEDKNKILGTSFTIRLILAIFAYTAILFTTLLFESDTMTLVMILTYGICLFVQPFNIIRNYFTSILENEYIVKSEIFRTIVGGIIKVILLWFKVDLFWFVLASGFDFILVASGYYLSFYRKIGKISVWYYNLNYAKYLIKESFPLLLAGTAIIIYQKIDHVMIKNMIDTQALGYYAAADKILNVFIFLPLIITQTIAPIIIRKREKDIEEYQKYRQMMVNIVLWVSLFLGFFIYIGSNLFISLTFGDEYKYAAPVVQILSFKIAVMSLSFTTGQIIIIEGLQKWAIYRDLTGAIVCISCNFIFIPYFGIIGAAYISILSLLATNILSCYLIKPYFFLLEIISNSVKYGWKDFYNLKKLIAS